MISDYTPLVVAGFALVGTIAGLLLQRRGQRDETHLETSKWVKQDLRLDYERLRGEFETNRDELTAARLEIVELRREVRRTRGAPDDLDTMKKFCDDWSALLNALVANPAGLSVEIYTDDYDQKFALGHRLWLTGHAPPDSVPSEAVILARMENLKDLVAKAQEDADAVPGDTETV